MKKITLLILFIALIPISLLAVKAYPGIVERPLPDGSMLQLRVIGDEYFSYTTTIDGYLIKETGTGYFEYAALLPSGELKMSGIKVSQADRRSAREQRYLAKTDLAVDMMVPLERMAEGIRQKAVATTTGTRAYPLLGSPKSLVILVNFTDVKFENASTASSRYSDLLNKVGYNENGATGSAVDYFMASSFNQFSPAFDVYGPYDLPNNMAYYGAESGGSNDSNPADMIRHACSAAANAGVNFADYDTDGDGFIDNVFVYYAGYNQAEGGGANTIWPHRSRLNPSYQISNGLYVIDYACTSEFRGSSGKTMCGIGTFCHEFGHVLGLPDWYDTDYGEMRGKTPQKWSIMDQGSYTNNGRTPPSYSAYERFFLGWTSPQQLSPGEYTLQPLITTNDCYLVAVGKFTGSGRNPNPNQFIMIENRKFLGWDEGGIPGEDLLITRINYNAANWSANRPNNVEATQGYEVMCAAGTTSSTPAANTYPGRNNVTAAYLTYRDGTDLNQPLTNIRRDGNNIVFLFAGGGDGYPSIVASTTLETFKTPGFTKSEPQILELIGTKLSEEVTIELNNGRHYEMRYETEDDEQTAPYGRTFKVTPDAVDSSFHVRLQVRFAPTGISYNNTWTDQVNVTNSEFSLRVPLSGIAPREIYVVPPTAYDAEDVTPYSFVAKWSDVYDAQGYYLTVHSLEKDVIGELKEDFTTFDGDFTTGWYATFNSITRAAMNSAPQAALFKTSLDTIYTETYFMPLSKISFWIQSYNSVGEFKIEGYNGESWNEIDLIEVTTSLRGQVKEYPLSVEDGYIRFRMSYDYFSGSGGLAFDDFIAYTPDRITYHIKDMFVKENEATLSSMQPRTEYRYRVQATDIDSMGRYENITDYSNEIAVETLEGSAESDKSIMISVSPSGDSYMVFVADYNENSRIYIYTVDGRLVSEVTPTSNSVELPKLTSGLFYILKYSDSTVGIKRKDKYAKFFNAL